MDILKGVFCICGLWEGDLEGGGGKLEDIEINFNFLISVTQPVLKLVFADRIIYDRENGFGTANLSLPLRVFELSNTTNSFDVDPRRIGHDSTSLRSK